MKTTFRIIPIVILVGCGVSTTSSDGDQKILFEKYKKSIEEGVVAQNLNENIKLDTAVRIYGVDDKPRKLSELFKSLKLVVRSSETGCGMCVERELEILREHSQQLGIENVLIIGTHSGSRKLTVFKEMNNIEFETLYSSDFNFPFERQSQTTYAFLIGPDLIARHFFISDFEYPELSHAYYSSIGERYFYSKSKI